VIKKRGEDTAVSCWIDTRIKRDMQATTRKLDNYV
jgi:hypothetical protein